MSGPAPSMTDAAAAPSIAAALLAELLAIHPAAGSELAEKAQLCLFDHLSCAFGGRDLPWAGQAIRIAGRWPAKDGAPIIGTGLLVPPAEAAFVNSIMAASASRTDIHAASVTHPSAVVFPVALALAGLRPVSGAEFLAAVIAGYEAMGRLGRIVVDQRFKRHFRATSVLGTVGGAVTGARILGLDLPRAVHAVSLSANTAAGLMEWGHSGEVDLFYQPANAARAAVSAVLLAAEGARASASILEGPAGLLAAFGGRDRAGELLARGDRPWEIELIDYKPVPICVFAQAAAFAAQDLVDRHRPDPASVSEIAVRTFDAAIAYPGCDNPGPIQDIQPARMSLQHAVASVIGRGGLGDENFIDYDEPATRRLTGKVRLEAKADFSAAFPSRQGAEVEARLDDGQVLRGRVEDIPRFGRDEVMARFRRTGAKFMPAPQLAELERLCGSCADLDDIGALVALLRDRQSRP